jgi:4-hydroxy-3-methylbut-2-enyl diphosphate reductase
MSRKKPKIKTAKTAGFCFGVRRAIELAEKTGKQDNKVYTLGPLIHNPQEVNRLAREGIKAVSAPWRLKGSALILRTHGITESFRNKLKSKDLRLVDATCPFVKRAQDIVNKLSNESFYTVIVGDHTHPEVIALVSYAKGKCMVIEKESDLKKLKSSYEKIGILSQTTQSLKNFRKIVSGIRKKYKNAKIYNTICRATMARQQEAKNIAGSVDVMIVIGGKNSGNTKRLYQISKGFTNAYHIEKADEIKPFWFKKVKSIGITAGASTPDWIISSVKEKIGKLVSIAG